MIESIRRVLYGGTRNEQWSAHPSTPIRVCIDLNIAQCRWDSASYFNLALELYQLWGFLCVAMPSYFHQRVEHHLVVLAFYEIVRFKQLHFRHPKEGAPPQEAGDVVPCKEGASGSLSIPRRRLCFASKRFLPYEGQVNKKEVRIRCTSGGL